MKQSCAGNRSRRSRKKAKTRKRWDYEGENTEIMQAEEVLKATVSSRIQQEGNREVRFESIAQKRFHEPRKRGKSISSKSCPPPPYFPDSPLLRFLGNLALIRGFPPFFPKMGIDGGVLEVFFISGGMGGGGTEREEECRERNKKGLRVKKKKKKSKFYPPQFSIAFIKKNFQKKFHFRS